MYRIIMTSDIQASKAQHLQVVKGGYQPVPVCCTTLSNSQTNRLPTTRLPGYLPTYLPAAALPHLPGYQAMPRRPPRQQGSKQPTYLAGFTSLSLQVCAGRADNADKVTKRQSDRVTKGQSASQIPIVRRGW